MDIKQYDDGSTAIWDDVNSVDVVRFQPGGVPRVAATGAITAFATGGQASGTLLTSGFNRISVCATAADSVKLPVSAKGMWVRVVNNGAAAAAVFPGTGDAINGLGANNSLTLGTSLVVDFHCDVAGTWITQLPIRGAQYVKNTTVGVTTSAAGDLTGIGVAYVQAEYSAVGAANLTTRTATQMVADGALQVGDSYVLEITNTSGGTTTVVGGTGVTVTGTATIATNATRRFNVKVNTATTMTLQSTGVGTIS